MTELGSTLTGSGFGLTNTVAHIPLDSSLLPLQGEEFCATAAGGLMQSFVGIMIVVFFAVILIAIFVAGGIESMPVSGWWNQMGYSMMGKVPIAIIFVIVMISVINMTLASGTLGVGVPSCIPILG